MKYGILETSALKTRLYGSKIYYLPHIKADTRSSTFSALSITVYYIPFLKMLQPVQYKINVMKIRSYNFSVLT